MKSLWNLLAAVIVASLALAACIPDEEDDDPTAPECLDPAEVEAEGGWYITETDTCAVIKFACEPGFMIVADGCGCGCIVDPDYVPTEPVGCGGWLGDTCEDTEYCAYVEGQTCGWADASATCATIPDVCPANYDPVCGCDNATHPNSCMAAMAGTGVLHAGECAPQPGGACGGMLGDTCASDEYCAYTEGQSCGWADATATCAVIPEVCPANYAPVCGCDGNTHSNSCFAAMADTGVLHDGECQSQPTNP